MFNRDVRGDLYVGGSTGISETLYIHSPHDRLCVDTHMVQLFKTLPSAIDSLNASPQRIGEGTGINRGHAVGFGFDCEDLPPAAWNCRDSYLDLPQVLS